MRDFFINGFEKLVAVLIVLLGVAVVVGAFAGLSQEVSYPPKIGQ